MSELPVLLESTQTEDAAEYTFISKYARYDSKKKRRETWNEAVDRVRDMHLQRYGNKGVEDEINWAFEMVREKYVLPSMRSMQFGGEAIIANDARMYNCAFTHANRHRFFSEAFWMLLSGCGVGFSVQFKHVNQLPKLIQHQNSEDKEIFTYTVADTIEGWADTVDVLMSTYFQGTPNSGREVFFDFSRIRRKGSWLKTSGGRAPGAGPLKLALKRIKKVLREAVEAKQEKLEPIQVYDITMMAADAVVSGGVRRSATIAIFSPEDEKMMKAKTFYKPDCEVLTDKRKDGTWLTEFGPVYNLKKKNSKKEEPSRGDIVDISWFNLMPWRARSNNSAALLRAECTREQFASIVNNAKMFGEPGFAFLEDLDYGANPCLTGDSRLLTEDGYQTLKELWERGGCHNYDINKTVDQYGTINIVNSYGIVKATNVYKTSDAAKVFKITLMNGSIIKATNNHSFFVLEDGQKIKKKLYDLKIGDKLPINEIGNFGLNHDPDYGVLAGWVIGDGAVSFKSKSQLQRAHVVVYHNDINEVCPILKASLLSVYNKYNKSTNQKPQYNGCRQSPKGFNFDKVTMESLVLGRLLSNDGIKPKEKHNVPLSIWKSDKITISSFLRGLFSADGSVQISNGSISIRLSQVNYKLLNDVKLLLYQFGITSTISHRATATSSFMNDGKGGKKLYNRKDSYEIIISGVYNVHNYMLNIGFLQSFKNQKAYDWLNQHNGSNNSFIKFSSDIKSIEFDSVQETFCLTEFNNNEIIVNGVVIGNCHEIGLYPVDPETKETGWQVCNLCEVNGAKLKTEDDFRKAVKAATIIGTLQAGYTYFHYLTDVSRRIIRRERLLGVSVTGWMENPDLALNPDVQRKMATYAVEINHDFANKLGIEPAARVTTTKPSGTSSLILGTSSGIHPYHARSFFKRIQASSVEQPLQYFKLWNPQAVDNSVWTDGNVITFAFQAPKSALIKDDLNAIQFLKLVKLTYENWVVPGTARPESSPGLTHNVSNTVRVGDDEWDELIDFIYDNRYCFSGVSLIPKTGDKIYPQAPNEEVTTVEDVEIWNHLVTNFSKVNWVDFVETEDYTTLSSEVACAGGACEI